MFISAKANGETNNVDLSVNWTVPNRNSADCEKHRAEIAAALWWASEMIAKTSYEK